MWPLSSKMKKRGSSPPVRIRGVTPSPWGNAEKEQYWREYIAEDVGKRVHQPLTVPDNTQFEVKIEFYFISSRFFSSGDLDNLAKPVLDTLFRQRAASRFPTGCLFKLDDARVTSLLLTKQVVGKEEHEGAKIRVHWKPSKH